MPRDDERERIRRRLGALTTATGPGHRTSPPGRPAAARGGADPAPDFPATVPEQAVSRWQLDEAPDSEDTRAPESGRPGRYSRTAQGVDDAERAAVTTPHWLAETDPSATWRDRLVPSRFRDARANPGRRGVVATGIVGVLAVLVTAFAVVRDRPIAQAVPPVPPVRPAAVASPTSVAAQTASTPEPAAELVVSVVGLVQHTGLVRLPQGSRVADAVAAAGGAREGADLTGLNLAQRLADGDQVVVGALAATPGGGPRPGSVTITAQGRSPSGPAAPTGRIDLNTADESDLDALPGVGPVTARAIIAWREVNGRFTDVEQLGDIDGIGPARLARLRELVTI